MKYDWNNQKRLNNEGGNNKENMRK